MKNLIVAMLLVAAMATQTFAQQCGGSNRVDLGNAQLGEQLILSQRSSGGNVNAADVQLAQLSRTMQQLEQQITRQASASSSSSAAGGGGLTQPGMLTFRSESNMQPIPEMPATSNDMEVMKQMIAGLQQEIQSLRGHGETRMYLTGGQGGGGASAASSASSSAPQAANLAITQDVGLSRSSQSNVGCSSGGCGGRAGFLQRVGGGRRNVSRSRSFSSTSSR